MSVFKLKPGYKPFTYPWADEGRKKQLRAFWIPESISMSDDVNDWKNKLNDQERHLLTQIFRFFTQADSDVACAYADKYLPVFKNAELQDMMLTFGMQETIHKQAYSLLIETIGMPESTYSEFLAYKEMADKHDYLEDIKLDSVSDIARSVAIFSAFTEGMQLFSSFAILLSFSKRGLMNGMGQIVSWSVRDETIHCNYMIKVFNQIVKENPEIATEEFKRSLYDIARKMVELEDAFIDLCFQMGDVEGLDKNDVKLYIRYIADRRLTQLGLKPNFEVASNPLPWVDKMVGGVEMANFFETKATAYSKVGSDGFGF